MKDKTASTLVFSILGMTLALLVIIPITKYFLGNEKIKNETSVRIQEQNIIENEWNKINLERTEDLLSKKNTQETYSIDVENELFKNKKFNIQVDYGIPQDENNVEEGLIALPITITVEDENKQFTNLSRTGKVYTNKRIDDGLVKNLSPKETGIKYNEKFDLIEYYYNGEEVMKSKQAFSSGTGYVKFKNGLIMQYGNRKHVWFDERHLEKTEFPIPYPNKCMIVLTSVKPPEGGGDYTAYVHDYNNTYFNVLPGYFGAVQYGDYYWISLGY